MKKYVLALAPFDTSMRIIVGTPTEARKWIKTSAYEDTKYDFEVGGALLSCEEYWPVMFINSNLTKAQKVQTFAHECVHVINHIFDRVGVLYSSGNDEQYAFMMSYLIRQAQDKKII